MTTEKTLTLKPLGGLCNRLFAIDSAIKVCEDIGFDLDIIWIRNEWLMAGFNELFRPIGNEKIKITFKDFSTNPFLYSDKTLDYPKQRIYNSSLRFYQSLFFDWISHGQKTRSLVLKEFEFNTIKTTRYPYISSWMKLRPEPLTFSHFVPIQIIMDRIELESKKFNDNTIGVHVRRTDHATVIKQSPLSLYFEMMDSILLESSEKEFFVSSDSENVKNEIKAKYKEKVTFMSPGKAVRTSYDGMEEAVVDLFLLSRTVRIMGNSLSSFAKAASEIGNIPLEEVVR